MTEQRSEPKNAVLVQSQKWGNGLFSVEDEIPFEWSSRHAHFDVFRETVVVFPCINETVSK